MSKTIESESKKLSHLVVDLDKFRKRYFTTTSDGFNIEFVSPLFYSFEKYRFYLLSKSLTFDLDQKYYYRPDYLSYDYYNVVSLWALILFINNVTSIDEFSISKVILPSYTSILNISAENENIFVPINLNLANIENYSQFGDVYVPRSAPDLSITS